MSPANLLQTLSVQLPGGSFPFPRWSINRSKRLGDQPSLPRSRGGHFARPLRARNGRLYYAEREAGGRKKKKKSPARGRVDEFDVVHTVLAPHERFRLTAAYQEQPASAYTQHRSTRRQGHSLPASAAPEHQVTRLHGWKIYRGAQLQFKMDSGHSLHGDRHQYARRSGDTPTVPSAGHGRPAHQQAGRGATKRIAGRVPYFDNSGAEYVGEADFLFPEPPDAFSRHVRIAADRGESGCPLAHAALPARRRRISAVRRPTTSGSTFLDAWWWSLTRSAIGFSTSGKINLNYLDPALTYIACSTGLRERS